MEWRGTVQLCAVCASEVNPSTPACPAMKKQRRTRAAAAAALGGEGDWGDEGDGGGVQRLTGGRGGASREEGGAPGPLTTRPGIVTRVRPAAARRRGDASLLRLSVISLSNSRPIISWRLGADRNISGFECSTEKILDPKN